MESSSTWKLWDDNCPITITAITQEFEEFGMKNEKSQITNKIMQACSDLSSNFNLSTSENITKIEGELSRCYLCKVKDFTNPSKNDYQNILRALYAGINSKSFLKEMEIARRQFKESIDASKLFMKRSNWMGTFNLNNKRGYFIPKNECFGRIQEVFESLALEGQIDLKKIIIESKKIILEKFGFAILKNLIDFELADNMNQVIEKKHKTDLNKADKSFFSFISGQTNGTIFDKEPAPVGMNTTFLENNTTKNNRNNFKVNEKMIEIDLTEITMEEVLQCWSYLADWGYTLSKPNSNGTAEWISSPIPIRDLEEMELTNWGLELENLESRGEIGYRVWKILKEIAKFEFKYLIINRRSISVEKMQKLIFMKDDGIKLKPLDEEIYNLFQDHKVDFEIVMSLMNSTYSSEEEDYEY